MARLERGKGKRKRSVEIRRRGSLLERDEVDGPSVMLTGYRRFSSESAARAAQQQEVARLLGEKLEPADDEARAIAAALPKDRPAGKPTLPIRQDLYVYNEATGFMVLSRRMAGKVLEEGSAAWSAAVARGDMIPLSLIQDDPFVVRVLVGGELEPTEAEEWVSRVDWHLNVPDGKLCVTGGAVLVYDDYDPDDAYYDQFVRMLDVPKGRYRASIYAYVPGINGDSVLDHVAGGERKREPIGRWFRRTRPGEPFPAWLRNWCAGTPSDDPGHEAEWKGVPLLKDEEWPDYVHFLLHLTPVDEVPTEGLSEAPADGWFGEAWNARMPERCPLGLEGRAVVGHIEESSGAWTFVRDLAPRLAPHALAPITGGPVDVPLADAARLFRMALFTSRFTLPEIRAVLPEGGDWTAPAGPAGVVAIPDDRSVRIAFGNDRQPAELVDVLAELAATLATLPDGTVLALDCATTEDMDEIDPLVGIHRYRGELRGGSWRIAEAFPALDAATLRRALVLAAEIESGTHFAIADEAEGRAIVAFATANFRYHVEDHPAAIEGGELRIAEPHRGVLALYGAGAFAERFAATWPVTDLSDDDDDGDEPLHAEPGKPPRGAEVLAARSGRRYVESRALDWDESLAERIRAEEPKLAAAGFKHVADVLCEQFSNVVVRAYARPQGTTWATFLVGAPTTLVFELSSRFGDGASLLTNRSPQAKDEPSKHSYRQGLPDAQLGDLLARHEARLAELEAAHGPPLRTVPSARGLAESVEAALVKQLG